jgi:predicted metal-dependent RNase
MRLSFKEMKDEIAKIVPKDIKYDVDLEAGDIAIITPTPDAFGGGEGLIGKIAKKIKRRIVLRPHASIMKDEKETEQFIRDLIEDISGIDSIISMLVIVK